MSLHNGWQILPPTQAFDLTKMGVWRNNHGIANGFPPKASKEFGPNNATLIERALVKRF